MNSGEEKDIGYGELVFIAGWWILLFLFCGTGLGTIALLWVMVSAIYFIFHPDKLAPKGVVFKIGISNAIHLFEVIASTILLSYIFTCVAWSISFHEGVFEKSGVMFYVIGLSFLLMGVISLTGVSSYLLLASRSHENHGCHIYVAVVAALCFAIVYIFPDWIFSEALSQVQHKAHFYVINASLVAYLAYYLLRKRT